jgi:uncharacterized protein YcgL (UPF0745 family)
MVDEGKGKSPYRSMTGMTGPDASCSAPRGSILCEVFRSPRREGMYLYVERAEGLARVPEELLQRFGAPEPALVFRLHGERRLARASAAEVLKALAAQGFYLQMPPVPGAVNKDAEPGAQRTAPVACAPADREDPSC